MKAPVLQFLTLFLSFSVRHKLSNEAISDLLSFIRLLCPFPNGIPSTNFWSQVTATAELNRHYVCRNCQDNLTEDEDKCPSCSTDIPSLLERKYFTTLSLESQLKSLYQSMSTSDVSIILLNA